MFSFIVICGTCDEVTISYAEQWERLDRQMIRLSSSFSAIAGAKIYDKVSKDRDMKRFYLVLTVLGILLPYGAFVPWLVTNGADIKLLFSEATANPISIFAWLDVFISAIVLLVFIISDGVRNKVRYWYLPVLGTLLVGVSCGLPLYLYFKELDSLKHQPVSTFN
jgi:hypothetical protein